MRIHHITHRNSEGRITGTWIDLDHVAAINGDPEDGFPAILISLMFRDKPMWIEYRGQEEYELSLKELLEAWKNRDQ